MFKLLFVPVASYLMGSIPFGLLITRIFSDIDVRKYGSGNIGATNVLRTTGPGLAILTLLSDVLKGAVPVFYASTIEMAGKTESEIFLLFVALAAFFGHLFPCYSKFKNGGKGVATAAGSFMAISPMGTIVSILTFILFVCTTNRSSVGSLAASIVLPIAIYKATHSFIFTTGAVAIMIFIVIRHKENIIRLLRGTEPTIR